MFLCFSKGFQFFSTALQHVFPSIGASFDGVVCTMIKNTTRGKISSYILIFDHNNYFIPLVLGYMFSLGGSSLWGVIYITLNEKRTRVKVSSYVLAAFMTRNHTFCS